MNVIVELGNVNLLAIAGAVLSSFVLAMTWYSWPVFGKAWAGLLGMTKEEADNTEGLAPTLVIAIVGSLVTALFLAVLISVTNTNSIVGGIMIGALAGFAFRFTSLAFHNGFTKLPFKLTLINASHDIVQMALMGGIIGHFS